MTEIGFVGLGQMGSRMALRLVEAGHKVIVFDLSADALQALADKGARAAGSLSEVGDSAEIVLCSLPKPDIVGKAILGEGGIAAGKAVKIIVDLSTTGPTKIEEVARGLAPRGIALVDAPVSGGVKGAAAGTLTLMVAGDPASVDRVDPILRCMGKNIYRIGDEPGLGQKMKLVNNMLYAANGLVAFEGLVMGAKAGLDAEKMLEVINVSSGRSFFTTDKIPQCVMLRTFPEGFATELLLKDLRLGIEEAHAIDAPLWMMETAERFLDQALPECDPQADYASVIKYFECRAGAEVGARASKET